MKPSKGNTLLSIILLLGIVSIFVGVVDKHSIAADRIAYIVIGVILCIIALCKLVRHILAALLFVGLFTASIPAIFAEQDDRWLNIAICIIYLCFAVYFFRKVFPLLPRRKTSFSIPMQVDQMSGLEFEHFTAYLLENLGYTDVTITKASGDHGVDVLANCDGLRYAFQCKLYHSPLGNAPIQEVYAGMTYYSCDIAVVITNSTFTKGAQELAAATGVLLWDRQVLYKLIRQSGIRYSDSSITSFPPQFEESSSSSDIDPIPPSITPQQKPASSFNSHRNSPSYTVDPTFIAEAQWYAARKDRISDSK